MSSTTTTRTATRRMMPQVKLPSRSGLARLTSDDRALLEQVISEPVEYIMHPMMRRRTVEISLFGAEASLDQGRSARFLSPPPLPGGDGSHAEAPGVLTFTPEQELVAFQRFNYARYMVYKLLRTHRGKRLTVRIGRRVIAWQQRALDARTDIVQANVPLVLAMAKHTRLRGIDFYELTSEGNMALLRAIDRFDCSRGFKFSTYACSAIIKSFSRVAMRTARHRRRFANEFNPDFQKSDYVDTRRRDLELACVSELQEIMANNTANFSAVEQEVIRARFALDTPSGQQPNRMTLEQIGRIIGVTKERVRQIQNQALAKLKLVLEESVLAA